MEHALQKLGFTSLDEITSDSLKQAFRSAVVNAHPDKGGSDTDFEEILEAYVHLSSALRRMTGGRDGFKVLHAFDVKQARDEQFTNELNNLVSDVFDHLDINDHEAFRVDFNAQFEKNHIRENERGYEEWLKSEQEQQKNDMIVDSESTSWNRTFESAVKLGKPEPTALILHPEQMAFVSGSTRGSALITSSERSFTSDPEECPDYTDLHDAYTSENTVFDKVPLYQEKVRTLDDILKERDTDLVTYVTERNSELEAITAYEKRKQEEEAAHKQKIEEYFKGAASSVWALKSSDASESFIKEFK